MLYLGYANITVSTFPPHHIVHFEHSEKAQFTTPFVSDYQHTAKNIQRGRFYLESENSHMQSETIIF
jgi:hypothetical protein